MSIKQKEKTILEIKKNTRFGLIASILEKCHEPTTKSQLFFNTHNTLTYKIINQVVEQTLKAKLLKQQNNTYTTTRKGNRFIKQFKELLELLERKG